MKYKRFLSVGSIFTIITLALLPGCARPRTLGPDHGLAYRTAILHQTLNPEAGQTVEFSLGAEDGQAAKRSMERYRSSFESPEKYRTTLTPQSIVSQGVQAR